jgi:MFS family permease
MPIGILSDRLGIRRALAVAPAVSGAAFWTLGDGSVPVALAGGLVLFALHSAAENTLTRAGVAHFAPATRRGTWFGLTGACALLANVAAGWLWDAHGSAAALRVTAIVSLAATVPFLLLPARPESRS